MDQNDRELVSLVDRAQEALAAGDLPTARDAFEQAAGQFPQSPAAHNNLGAFYVGLGDPALAAASFAQASALMPDNVNVRFNLAVARLQAGQFAAAVDDFRAVVARAPRDPEAHNNLGVASFQADDPAGARAALLQALELQPNFPNAVLNLCDVEEHAGAPLAAVAHCESYLRRFRDLAVLRRYLMLLDAQARRALETAIPHAEALIQADGQDCEARRHLGRLLEARQALRANA